MKKTAISRRTMLRGMVAGVGASLALPLTNLEDADRIVLAVQQLGSLQTEALAFRYRVRVP